MSFNWTDQNVQRAFVYGCFESKQLAETAAELIKKHVTVDTLTVHNWYQEFKTTEHRFEHPGRREIEQDSETSQPNARRLCLGPTTDIPNSSALTQEIKEEVDDVEDFINVANTAETMNLIPLSSVKMELYEDCNVGEIHIYFGVDSVSIAKVFMDFSSPIPPQEFLYQTEDPTQYSFIHRAISELENIFNTPDSKLYNIRIDHKIDEDGVTEEKRKVFYKELQQMMAKLSKKLHLSCFEIEVESPEVLIGFLETIHPESLTQLMIRNLRDNHDMSQIALLERWSNLKEFYSFGSINISLSKLAHMSSVFAKITETTTNELKQYFKNLTATPAFCHIFLMNQPRLEPSDFSGTLQKHKSCDFSDWEKQRCYLLTDNSVVSVLYTGGYFHVRKDADSNSLYAERCYCG